MNQTVEARVVLLTITISDLLGEFLFLFLATLALQMRDRDSCSGTVPLGAPARVLLNQKLQYRAEYFRILIPRDQLARRKQAISAGITVPIISSR